MNNIITCCRRNVTAQLVRYYRTSTILTTKEGRTDKESTFDEKMLEYLACPLSKTPLSDLSRWWRPRSWIRWGPTSASMLAVAERKMLANVWNKLEQPLVEIFNNYVIRTVALNTRSKSTPIVLLHGLGAGVGLWVMNFGPLAANRPVYACDLLGFGRSSRHKFNTDPLLAEQEFVDFIEAWRQQLNLEKFVLVGHSLGGFLATAYTLRHPLHVRHLVLVDPWGFSDYPTEGTWQLHFLAYIKVIATILNPLAVVRMAGPWGPGLISRFRPFLVKNFDHLFEDDTVAQYIYHCNAQPPSGETAFKNMNEALRWAKYPMVKHVADLPAHLPITMLYGSRSWIDSGVGYQIKYLRQDSYVQVEVIPGAGHIVYADRADAFNDSVNRICQLMDAGLDVTSPIGIDGHTRRRRQSSECIPRPHERNDIGLRQQINENSHKAGSIKGKPKQCNSSPDFSSMKYTLTEYLKLCLKKA